MLAPYVRVIYCYSYSNSCRKELKSEGYKVPQEVIDVVNLTKTRTLKNHPKLYKRKGSSHKNLLYHKRFLITFCQNNGHFKR